MVCYAVDWVLFTVMHYFLIKSFGETSIFATVVPMVSARVISSFINFCINRRIFDNGDGSIAWMICKYYLLAVSILAMSTVTVYFTSKGLMAWGGISGIISTEWIQPIIKLPIDFLLYLVSYNVQRKFVFKKVGNN